MHSLDSNDKQSTMVLYKTVLVMTMVSSRAHALGCAPMRASNVHKEPQAQDRAASGTGSSGKMHKARKGDAVDGDDEDDEDDDGDDDDNVDDDNNLLSYYYSY